MDRHIYDNPEYYEIAFSFRDIPREVDVLEECIEQYSRTPVRRMLELACGPAPHMLELMRRNYDYVGLDLNRQMLDYATSKARTAGFSPTLIQEDLLHFSLSNKVDFAFVLLGSLYARNTQDLLNHFDSVADALNPGGLYLLDWCLQFSALTEDSNSWVIEKDRLRVETTYAMKNIDPAGQTFDEIIRLAARNADGAEFTLEEIHRRRAIYPQEFLLLLEKTGRFEFVGWWNNWNLNESLQQETTWPKSKKIERPITLIRRI